MDDLVAFFNARLDEDETAAEAMLEESVFFDTASSLVGDEFHYSRWSPERVLADVAAKRRILARHSPRLAVEGRHPGQLVCGCSNGEDEFYAVDWPCADVRDIVSPHAGHPDFREEWKA